MKLKCSEVRIENTNYCNANCIMCPREKLTRPRTVMPMDHFKYLAAQAKDMGAEVISIFGFGEPLVDEKLKHKVRYCTDLGLETFITTNAHELHPQKATDLLEAGLSHVRFSVHGLKPQTYESVHRGLKFDHVMRNIGNFIAKNKIQFNGQCKISVTVMPMHNEKIDDIRKFWEPHCDWLEIWQPHNWTGIKEYRKKTTERKQTCGRPFNGPVQINCDGKMMVCCFDIDADLTVGDTYQDTIEEILKGEAFEEIRRKHREGNLSGLICETCDQLNIEPQSPLLYSNRDLQKQEGRTSTTKHNLFTGEQDNDRFYQKT